jgi:hypothetical protein
MIPSPLGQINPFKEMNGFVILIFEYFIVPTYIHILHCQYETKNLQNVINHVISRSVSNHATNPEFGFSIRTNK